MPHLRPGTAVDIFLCLPRTDVAQRVGGLIWEVAKEPDESGAGGSAESR